MHCTGHAAAQAPQEIHFSVIFKFSKACLKNYGAVAPKTALPYGRDSCIAWNRCHIFTNKRGTYGIIADGLRFATQLSNVYGNAIRAKLAAAQTAVNPFFNAIYCFSSMSKHAPHSSSFLYHSSNMKLLQAHIFCLLKKIDFYAKFY